MIVADNGHRLSRKHPVAPAAAARCRALHTSAGTKLVAQVACRPCWEHAIEADERVVAEFDLPRHQDPDPDYVDEIAVERTIHGDHVTLTLAERVEVTRRLVARGVVPTHIANLLRVSMDTQKRLLTLANGRSPQATPEAAAA